MEEKQSNEEVLSRRGFFKKAAKGALPFIGIFTVSNIITLAQDNAKSEQTGCQESSCFASCRGTCSGTCMRTCRGTCVTVCLEDPCGHQCKGFCIHTCKGSCKGTLTQIQKTDSIIHEKTDSIIH